MKDSVPGDTNTDVSKEAGAGQKHSRQHRVTVKMKSSTWYAEMGEMYGDIPGWAINRFPMA